MSKVILQERSYEMPEPVYRSDQAAAILEERDVRVEDYLNDKLQTVADLQSLDSLLLNVQNHQELLKKQVDPTTSRRNYWSRLTVVPSL